MICCNCGGGPIPFTTDTGMEGHFIFTWKDDVEFCHLLSDGTLGFGVVTKDDPEDERFNYYCIDCIEKLQKEVINDE